MANKPTNFFNLPEEEKKKIITNAANKAGDMMNETIKKAQGEKRKIEKNYLVGEFNITGTNSINIEMVVRDWNELWFLSQYGAKFKLVKYLRKDSEATTLKTEITATQADKLIEKLGLGAIKSYPFRKGINWKRLEDE